MAKIFFHSRANSEISLGCANIEEKELYAALDKVNIGDLSRLYFVLNNKGNGLTLCSSDGQLESKIALLNDYLEKSNSNYSKQITMGTIEKLSFRQDTNEQYNHIRLKNANSKRLILKE
jgi:hypothetical protein